MLRKKVFLFLIAATFAVTSTGWGLEKGPAKPGPRAKCPVCGMFVAKYPDFVTQVVFKDGSFDFFDGSKDMFKYLVNLKKYKPGKKPADIKAVYVTDYYTVAPVDGMKAFYVQGSDVFGPMGREFIPFGKEADAKAFLKDHKGKRVLTFGEITESVLGSVD